MAVRNPADIRNIALVGSGGAGKTTLAERLLHDAGAIQRIGTIEDGTTISDWTDEEKHHGHSIRPSVLHFEHEGHWVNLIDTPGRGDFLGQAIACFPAVETVAVMVDAARGVDTTVRRLMKVAEQRNLPRMIIVNGIDHPEADCAGLLEQIRAAFGNECLPIGLPAKGGTRVINVFEHDGSDSEGNDADFSSVSEAHQMIVEQIVEMQDELMNTYLEQGEEGLDAKKLHDAFEAALRDAHLIPVTFVSAKQGAGIKDLMHIFASLLPSPLEGNPRPFLHRVGEGEEAREEEVVPVADAAKPAIAHIFKVASDPFVGKLGVFRVHQGTIKAKGDVFIDDARKPIRIAHVIKRQGKEHVEVEAIGPGDIGAVAKIEEVRFDGVLHGDHDEATLHLKPLPLPEPMYGLAIELKDHKDETKFASAIHKLTDEDPSLRLERIAATKQTVLRGLGELHLRVALEKLKDAFGIEVNTSIPKVAYKETIRAEAEASHRHKKQSGGSGEFGEVHLRVAPLPAEHETGFEFVNATVGGSIPRQFMPAIEKGIRQVLEHGAVAGYPMTGVRVEVFDGKHHAVDSKEIAFIKAGKRAFIDAVSKAKPALLEPFVEVEVNAPASFMGDLTGDLSVKRGRVQDTDMGSGDQVVIRAHAPLGELQNYSTELKSITHGAGSYSMAYSHDEQTPPHVQQEVVAAFEGHGEED